METMMGMAAETDTVGTLDTLPLADLLVHLLDRQATGTLVLEEPSGRRSAFYFHFGAAAKAKTPACVATATTPNEALSRQFRWAAMLSPETSYRFYARVDYLRELPRVQAEPLAHIWECVQQFVDVMQLNRALEGLAEQPLVLHPLANLRRFGLSERDQGALEPLKHRLCSFNDLMLRCEGDTGRLCRLMYLLVVCRCLKREGMAQPAGLPPVTPALEQTTSAITTASDSQAGTRAEEDTRRPSSIPTVTPPTDGLECEPETVRQTAELRRVLTEVPRGIPTPHSGVPAALARTLGRPLAAAPPAWGGRSFRPRQPPSPTSRRPSLDLTAADASSDRASRPTIVEGDWRRVEALVRQCEFGRALECAEHLCGDDAMDAERSAYIAYLKARTGPISADEGKKLLAGCTKAVDGNPIDAQYLFYRAWVLRALGQEDAALADFTAVVAKQPSHIDAAREVHIARKRREASLSPVGIVERIRRSLVPAREAHTTSATGHHHH